MKLNMRKLMALALALTIVFTMALSASAEGFWSGFNPDDFDYDDVIEGIQDILSRFQKDELPEVDDNLQPEWDYEPHWPEIPDIPPLEDCPSKHFTDVDTVRWYHPGVDFCVSRGIMIGTSATTFEPNANITRGQLVTMLWRQAGCPAAAQRAPFVDVKSGSFYAEAVDWAYENGVVLGISATKFAPEADLSRQDMAVLLYRYTEHYLGIEPVLGVAVDLNWLFPDAEDVSDYAVDAVRWAVARSMILGEPTSSYEVVLNPLGNATRAQMANVFCRYCVNVLGWL